MVNNKIGLAEATDNYRFKNKHYYSKNKRCPNFIPLLPFSRSVTKAREHNKLIFLSFRDNRAFYLIKMSLILRKNKTERPLK